MNRLQQICSSRSILAAAAAGCGRAGGPVELAAKTPGPAAPRPDGGGAQTAADLDPLPPPARALSLAWACCCCSSARPGRAGAGDSSGYRQRPRRRHCAGREPQHAGRAAEPPGASLAALNDLADHLEEHGGARLALIVFAARPHLVFPLTRDYDHFRTALDEIKARRFARGHLSRRRRRPGFFGHAASEPP